MKKSVREQAQTGLRMGFGTVAGFLIMCLVIYGFVKIRHPESDDTLIYFLKGYPPLLVGSISLTLGVAILWSTMNRWAKFLSGLFAYAVFGGLIAVAGGGFHSKIPSLQVTRLEAAIVTALYAVCAVLTYRLGSGELNRVDRAAILAAPLLLTWTASSNDRATGFEALGAMVALFAAAAAYSHFWVHGPKKRRRRAPGTISGSG